MEKEFIQYETKTIRKDASLVKNILIFTKGCRLPYLTAIASQGLSVLFDSLMYVALAWFVDDWLMTPDDRIPLWQAVIFFFLLSSLHAVFSYFAGRLMNKTAESVSRRLKNCLFDHMQYLSFTWHDKADTGDLIVRATTDIDAVRQLFSEQIYGICRVLFYFGINLYNICRIDLDLGLTTLIILPLIIGTSFFFFKKIGVIYEQYQNEDSIVSSILQENLYGVRVVKAFARQDFEKDKFNEALYKRYKTGEKEMFIEALFWPSSDLLCWIQLGISLYIGAQKAYNGVISLGGFIAFASLVTMIVWPLRNLGRQIVHMSRSFISFRRIQEILTEIREPIDEGLKEIPGLRGEVCFDHVSFAYTDEKQALDDITFEAKAGETIALIGSTGSGKTSLINLLPRFYEYTCGSIKLDGIELQEISRDLLRNTIGIVEQEPFLFSATIAENIAYGVAEKPSEEKITAAAKAAGIHETILEFEKGYETLVGERGVTLSGGQRQRIAIARALLKDPRILVLDDSLTAVDTETEARIQSALNELMKGRTTFIIAHRTTSIVNADRILVMKDGKIIQSGKHEELIRQNGMYRKIHNIQTRIEDELESELNHE